MSWLSSRRTTRHARRRAAVRRALLKLKDSEGFVADIMALSHLSSGAVYVALAQLSGAGDVVRRRDDTTGRYSYRLTASHVESG